MKNNSTGDQFVGCIIMVIVLVMIVIFSSILNGYALAVVWEWFIVPKFNLPSLSVKDAILLSAIVYSFQVTQSKNNNDKSSYSKIISEIISIVFLKPLFLVVFFYVVINWF